MEGYLWPRLDAKADTLTSQRLFSLCFGKKLGKIMEKYSDSSTMMTRGVKFIIISHNFFPKTPRRQWFQIVPRRGINVPGCGTFVPGRGNARKAVPFGRLLAVSVGSHFVKNPPVSVCFYMLFARLPTLNEFAYTE